MKNENDEFGKITPPGEVRIIRMLPGPIERVWDYLVDPEKRGRWFAGGPMEQRQGGRVELVFNHKSIAPDEAVPDDHQQFQGLKKVGKVLRWEPPRVLSYMFDDESDVTFELKPQGKSVQLVLTHRSRGGDVPYLTGYAGGWHTCLAQLIALVEGAPRPPFWPMHARLKVEYEKIRAAAKG